MANGSTTDITIQAQSTDFERQGFSIQKKGYSLPSDLVSFIAGAYFNASFWGGLSQAEQIFLLYVLSQDPQCLPGGATLAAVQSMFWDLFNGSADLQQIYQQDPFSTQYEDNTADLYNRQYLIARSTAQSGPTNVRGGTARQGFELAELDTLQAINRFREIWQNQMAMAQLVIQATHVANQIEEARRSAALNAQRLQAGTEQGRVQQALAASEQVSRMRNDGIRANAAGAEFLGVPIMRTDEDLAGIGFQQGVTTSFGTSYWR